MTTAKDQITSALRLIGQLAEGETATAATLNDALDAFNQMLDSWSTERLSIYATQDQVFTWPANTATRTIGPSGDFMGVRPISLDDSTYFNDSAGVSSGISIINQQQYNGIAVKTATSTDPQVLWINMDMPDATMTVYPVPTSSLEFHIVSVDELSQPATLTTTLSFPPGYKRAFKFNLACEIAAEFGVEPPASVQRLAMVSKRNLKRQNAPKDVMSLPSFLMGKQRFNIYSGDF
jgi:hypothetical protein